MHRFLLALLGFVLIAGTAEAQIPKLYFTSNETGVPQVYRSDLDGSHIEQLTYLTDGALWPFGLNDGTKVGFVSNGPTLGGAVWVMDPDGTNQEQWSDPGLASYRPYYSATRQELWCSGSTCSEGFKILDIASKTVRDFSGGPLSWSATIVGGCAPDNILYTGCTCGNSTTCEIYSATLVGDDITDPQPLTNDSSMDFWVQVSEAGDILYVKSDSPSGHDYPTNIYTNTCDGSGETARTFYTNDEGVGSLSWSFEDSVIYYTYFPTQNAEGEIRRLDLTSNTNSPILAQSGMSYRMPVALLVFDPCMLGEGPVVSLVEDVPNDQGRQLRVAFDASPHDMTGSLTPILQYEVFRKVSNLTKMRTGTTQVSQPQASAKLVGWEYVGAVPAHGESEYNAIVPTLIDENELGYTNWETDLFVRAATADPYVYFDSCHATGISIDNLSPNAPSNALVAYDSSLGEASVTWDESPEDDVVYYRVYRANSNDASPQDMDNVAESTDTSWTDTDAYVHRYYFIAAVDHTGNESERALATESTITGIGTPQRATIVLYNNVPNPFNPSTVIRFKLGSNATHARLRVYDAAGHRVCTLINGSVSAGLHEVRWNGLDNSGHPAASGTYFYRLDANEQVKVKSMTLIK